MVRVAKKRHRTVTVSFNGVELVADPALGKALSAKSIEEHYLNGQ
jgi:hypothetical protein